MLTLLLLQGYIKEDFAPSCLIYYVLIILDHSSKYNCPDCLSINRRKDGLFGVVRYETDVYNMKLTMKKDIHHSNYRFVVFEDLNNGTKFLTRSTVTAEETIKWEDGNEYPLVKVHISSTSHPFFTGQEKLLDMEGRVDKFEARKKAAEAARAAKTTKKPRKTADKQVETAKIGDVKA